jgi:23S rRNA pseudoU1915 N3-methylase RlmH
MAASTLSVNLTMRSDAFRAEAQKASTEIKALGQTSQKLAASAGGMASALGSAVPMMGPLGGAISQISSLAAEAASNIGKMGVANTIFATGPAVAAAGAMTILAGTIRAVVEDNRKWNEMLQQNAEFQAKLAESGKDKFSGPETDISKRMEREIAVIAERRKALEKEARETTPGYFTSKPNDIRNAAIVRELEMVRKLEAAATKLRDEERMRAQNAADLKAMEENARVVQQTIDDETARQTEGYAKQFEAFLEFETKRAEVAEENRKKDRDFARGWLEEELRLREELSALEEEAAQKRQRDAEAQLRESQDANREYAELMYEATRPEKELVQRLQTGRADVIDTARVSLEGLRMNAQAEDTALLRRIAAATEAQVAAARNNQGGIPA